IAKSPVEAAAEADRLGKLPSVKQTLSLVDFLPKDQTAKLGLIEDLNFALGPDLAGTPPAKYTGDDKADIQALRDLRAALAQATKNRKDATAENFRKLDDRLASFDSSYSAISIEKRPAMLARLRENLLGALPSMLASLHDSLQASAFEQKDLPK